MFHSDPVALPGLAALASGAFAFACALLLARRHRVDSDAASQRFSASTGGVVLQGVGIALAGAGPVLVNRDPLSPLALAGAAAIVTLMTGAVALFVTATRAMGRNWSIRARTRADHRLVQEGPFRLVRNPICLAMALFLVAVAIAFGHTRQLLVAAPLFALGTAVRIRSEEALLRDLFGDAYDAYASRVKRVIPGVF